MRAVLAAVLAVLFAATGLVGCHQWTRSDRAATGKTGHAMWDCPHHPGMTSDRPGNCPKCGMMMKKMTEAGEGAEEEKGGDECDCHEEMPNCKCPHCKGAAKVCPCEEKKKEGGKKEGGGG